MRRLDTAGVTLVELLVYLVISSVVLASLYGVMMSQSRHYGNQRQLTDARESVRGAAGLLTWELRQLSAVGGGLYTIGANSIVLRSVQGSGIVCAKHATLPRYGLWGVAGGAFAATADDSALVFAAGGTAPSDDTWRVVGVTNRLDPVVGGVSTCAWAGGVAPAVVVEVSKDTSAVAVGALFRAFRKIEYGLFTQNGRTWLGRRIGTSTTWETLTGPLRSQADGGLVFTYYDSTGAVTANPTQVDMVEIVIRGESLGKARYQGAANPLTERIDSVRTRAFLRS